MFASLQSKLETAFKKIRGKGILTQKDIDETMREVRMALLEADVNFKIAKEFCEEIGKQAIGEEIAKSLSPSQHIVKLVHEGLIRMMGSESAELNLRVAPPAIIMLVGLQGSGKTTAAAKLGRFLKKELKRKPLLVPADVYRPAAIDQLKTLGAQIGVDVYDSNRDQDPLDIAEQAKTWAAQRGYDTLILDTAGRLQIDAELMHEVEEIKRSLAPHEILLVADAMTGQEAVNIAKTFDDRLSIDGLILTKLDGDARGGAALSMKAITGKPIKFIGVGEKPDQLEVFHPDRLASRILGMGDVLTLIEKAAKEIDLDDSEKLAKKLKKNELTLSDFLSQLRMIQRMGSVTSLMGMMPGMSKLAEQINPDDADRQLKHIEAIILSMTPHERENPQILNGARRRRIAKGSGRSVEEVNQLLKQFLEMKKMMAQLTKGGLGKLMGMMKGMPGMPPGLLKR